ncbi:hypothetical protein [Sphingomonas sp. VNH70]|uniref:hypothetical protein n=1 Tax=Sphingomonas silueang TaxID=3156617 RepID=UPI0032B34F6C
MPVWMLLAIAADETAVAQAVARARAMTTIDRPCRRDADADEVVICGGRTADRYRVPLKTPPVAGDPRAVDALGERERLLAVPGPACGMNLFLTGCGMVGATASSRSGVSGGATPRPLAK